MNNRHNQSSHQTYTATLGFMHSFHSLLHETKLHSAGWCYSLVITPGKEMIEVKELGEIVAVREMEFHSEDGKVEKALLKVGKPYEISDGLSWICPYELSTESHQELFGIHGIDALQALGLALSVLKSEVKSWEKHSYGKFYFLGEEGAELEFFKK